MPKQKKTPKTPGMPTPEEVSEAMNNCFKREMKYPTVKFGHFKKMVNAVPSEFDDTDVNFAFILSVKGKENFTIGTVPIKLMAVHPDQTKVLLCDDSAAEEFFKSNAKVTYASDEGLTDGPNPSH